MPYTLESCDFIPATIERDIGHNILFRPIRSWTALNYAGEGLYIVNGDRSGCLRDDNTCSKPLTVTHRMYWNVKTLKMLSTFLSYPNAMGVRDTYFWEIYPVEGDIERFDSESEMEDRIIQLIGA